MGRGCKIVLGCLAVGFVAAQHDTRRPVPEFKIDLDRKPEERYTEVVQHFNSSVNAFVNAYFMGFMKAPLRALLRGISAKRGEEQDEELRGEIRGYAALLGVDEYIVHAVQMLYELQTLMVPIDNITWPHFGVETDLPVTGLELPWPGPQCIGIVAQSSATGHVYHLRNQDFSPKEYMQDMVYSGVFYRGGKEIFRAQMLAAYSSIVTAIKMGSNGFSMETNTRYGPERGSNSAMLHNLLSEKRAFNGWTNRKIMEHAADYEAAVAAFSSAKYVAPQYIVLAGVRKGSILARSPEEVVYKMTLGQQNFGCRDDYIVVSNFDYWWHDIKENFDPTARGGHKLPRRVAAQQLLNATTEPFTPQNLFAILDSHYVQATDTIFQAVMSVEDGLWNVSLPPLEGAGEVEVEGEGAARSAAAAAVPSVLVV